MAQNLLMPTEAEAAALEGVVPVDADHELFAQIMLARALKEKRDAAVAEYNAVKEQLGKSLEESGKQGYTLGGKVAVRRSIVHSTRLDTKKFREKHPKLWQMFSITTESVRVTVD